MTPKTPPQSPRVEFEERIVPGAGMWWSFSNGEYSATLSTAYHDGRFPAVTGHRRGVAMYVGFARVPETAEEALSWIRGWILEGRKP